MAKTMAPEALADMKGMQGTHIKWGNSNMKNSCAKVCIVASICEEVVKLLGIHQAWNRRQQKVTILWTGSSLVPRYQADAPASQQCRQ